MARNPDLQMILTDALSKAGSASSDFDLNAGIQLPKGRVLKPAAVLIGVTENADVILTKRSARLKHHPGQVAFPGGKQDPTDATLTDAALREANEEIGLPVENVKPLGALPPHETVTSYKITPIVALIQGDFREIAEAGEVAEIFRAPLFHITNPANFRVEGRRWQGDIRHYYTVPYGPYYIWGATARILRGLAECMNK
ncbi:8-oxo-dGTP pyrophosphatase MutT, NUDIX family [Cognatiyoonia koreensis]|uniref:8-oxo-dGTP pyrophosphatase MutT, NUDIX family n=1 Tax=Cognatiyoonia koreensis TaxID=364200 RepID=A0A1I0RP09_9RHOB|nr:CoA pyrophosphatase [Cognatiyoonia koreensis]SEW42895.1 8-oxo-dGTP pyrophosphatase MutT, NUDIX family [Cognatiyoonia koreensis]